MAEFGTRYTLQFDADTTKLLQSLTTVERTAKKTESSVKGLAQSAKGAFSGFGFGDIAQIAAGASFITKTVGAYGQLINAQQTATQVFGDSYRTISDFAQQASEDVGLSERAAISLTTKVAALGKAAGLAGEDMADFSIDVVKLGADLAAAFNTSTERAVDAIISGLSGSSIEPLREYGIVINDNIIKNELFAISGEKVEGTLTQQERTLGITSILWQRSADYIGQFDREADGLVGTQQRLNASVEDTAAALGESLAPAAQQFLNVVLDITRGVASLNDKTGGLLGAAAGAIALRLALQPVIGPMKQVANSALQMGGAFAGIGAGMKGAIVAFDVWVALQAANSAYMAQTNKQVEALNAQVDEFVRRTPGMMSTADAFNDVLDTLRKTEARKDAGNLFDRMTTSVKDFTEELIPTRHETRDLGDDLEQLTRGEFQSWLRELAEDAPQTAIALRELAGKDSGVLETMEAYGIGLEELDAIIEQGATARGKRRAEDERWQKHLENLEEAAYGTAGGVDQLAVAAEKNSEAWDEWAEKLKTHIELQRKFSDTIAEFDVTRQERMAAAFGEIFDRPTGFDTLTSIRDVKQAFLDLADTAKTLPDDMASFLDPGNEAAGAFLSTMDTLRAQIGPELQAALEEGGTDAMFATGRAWRDRIREGMVEAGFSGEDIQQVLEALGLTTDLNKVATLSLEATVAEDAQMILDLMRGEGIVGLSDFLKLQASIEADPEATLNSLYAILQEDADISLPVGVDPDIEEAATFLESVDVSMPVKTEVNAAAEKTRVERELNRGDPVDIDAKLDVDDSELQAALRARTILINLNTVGDPDDPSNNQRSAPAGRYGNVTNYFTIPTADPSAHMRAVQRWSRLNGQPTPQMTRGR